MTTNKVEFTSPFGPSIGRVKIPENLMNKPMCNNNNIYNDVLLDPHTPPIKNDTTFNNLNNVKLMPINVATQSINTQYRQVGILTRVNEDDTILPLMGRPLITNRDKWNYYTMNDKNNMIKLPIIFRNKSCTSQQKQVSPTENASHLNDECSTASFEPRFCLGFVRLRISRFRRVPTRPGRARPDRPKRPPPSPH